MKPLITAGVLLNPGAQLTNPSAFTQPLTRSSSPSSCFERGEDGEPGQARRLVALLDREVVADLALDQDLGAVGGQMAGDVGDAAAHPDEVELELDPRRGGERSRQLQAELREPVLDPSHRPRSLVLSA